MQTPLAVAKWLADRQRRSWIVACLLFAALLLMFLRNADSTTHVAVAMLCLVCAVVMAWVGGDLVPDHRDYADLEHPVGTLLGPPQPLVSAVAQDLEAVAGSALCAPVCMPYSNPSARRVLRNPPLIVPLKPRVATTRSSSPSGETPTPSPSPASPPPVVRTMQVPHHNHQAFDPITLAPVPRLSIAEHQD